VQRRFRLTKWTDFKRVRRTGKSYAHPLVVLVACVGEGEATHFGVTAGRSVGNAVQRNQAKRRLRAALQPYLGRALPGWDVVLIARAPLANASFAAVEAALAELLRRSRLLKPIQDEPDSGPLV
jgi:ribonuclease P protein component